jgi:hypothetical protein
MYKKNKNKKILFCVLPINRVGTGFYFPEVSEPSLHESVVESGRECFHFNQRVETTILFLLLLV